MTVAREIFTATLLPSGKVLVAGGANFIASAELYDASAGTFVAAGNMTVARDRNPATLLPNRTVLLAGGDYASGGSDKISASAELCTE
jgi:hypothetical protein